MTILTINMPTDKEQDVCLFVRDIGGEILSTSINKEYGPEDDDTVTHGSYFGENIRRVINAFKD